MAGRERVDERRERDAPVALAAFSDAVLAIAGQVSVDAVLERLVDSARSLVSARYAAIGVPDEEGTGFARFVTAGMSDELIEAIGPLPRTHGLLGSLLVDATPMRTDDVASHPRFTWWPEAHPRMGSFMGVPIVSRGDVVGAFYLADKAEAALFDDRDEALVSVLAAHAAIALENARLHEQARELTIVEERTRMARELHDALTQTLFSLRLTAEAAAQAAGGSGGAAGELDAVRELAATALGELRSLVSGLRAPDLAGEGLSLALAKHLELVGRAHGLRTRFEAPDGLRLAPRVEGHLYRIAQEALSNVVRHADAGEVQVRLREEDGRVVLAVADDGTGFDPGARAIPGRRLGLTSMRERAEALGARFELDTGPGRGTTVTVVVARG